MGLQMLPEELLLTLSNQWPCRDLQVRQLSMLLSPSLPSPPAIIVHGLEATGKTGLTKTYLEAANIPHAFISCAECITGRHLLERTIAASIDALHSANGDSNGITYPRCEGMSSLTSSLERLLEHEEKFILVLDGIDEQREAPLTLMPALLRLGELIPSLTVVLIVTHPHPRVFHSPGVSHIHFLPYTREQAIQIVSANPPEIFSVPLSPSLQYTDHLRAEDNAWLWTRFCAAVWDTLASSVARDILSLKDMAERLWRPFVQPIVDGNFGTRDFSRLLVSQRKLFQSETALLDNVVEEAADSQPTISDGNHELPYYSKWLLCAAYLASFNPARLDATYFMRYAERKRRKKGGGTAKGRGRQSKTRKIPRHLLSPSAFSLDRLLAILHSILPHDLIPTMDMYTQLATLCSLRLLLRTAVIGGDVLESGARWKVNFGWDYASKLARSIDLDLTDYVAE